MSENNLAQWEMRRQALDAQMKDLENDIEMLPASTLRDNLYPLIRCLRVFVRGQFEFFRDGFSESGSNALTPSPDYPVAYVFRSIINQAYEDVQIIQHILNQRRDDGLNSKLDTADLLAWDALQPAIKAGLVASNTAVICYYQKTATIRLIPYAPIALIGLPFSAFAVNEDLLAIPHEVGHYVYRRGKYRQGDHTGQTLRGHIDTELDDLPKYASDWVEEIFADFYGCRVAGPVMALDFQDLQLQFSRKRFIMNDGDHPSPTLRPYIYTKVLHESGSEWAALLEALWESRRQDRRPRRSIPEQGSDNRDGDQFLFDDNNKIRVTSTITRGKGLNNDKAVERVLKTIFDALSGDIGEDCWQAAAWWGTSREQLKPEDLKPEYLNEAEIAAELYDEFKRTLNPAAFSAKFKESLKPLSAFSGQPDCYTEYLDDPDFLATLTANWPQKFFPNDPRPTRPDDPDHWWVFDVLFRAGWNTSGNGNWVKGP